MLLKYAYMHKSKALVTNNWKHFVLIVMTTRDKPADS